MNLLKNIRDKVTAVKAERRLYKKQLADYKARQVAIEEQLTMLEDAIEIVGLVIQGRYTKTVKFIEEVLSTGIQSAFDDSFVIKLNNVRKSNKNKCAFMLSCSEYPGFLPFRMCQGDGAKQITELILLIVIVSILDGRKIIFVDEPLTGLSKGARQHSIGCFLSKICNELEVQLIMVTHEPDICDTADNVIDISSKTVKSTKIKLKG